MVKARDVVEGAVKPGTSTLRAIGVLAPLMRKLGPRASPAYLPTVTWWSFYAGMWHGGTVKHAWRLPLCWAVVCDVLSILRAADDSTEHGCAPWTGYVGTVLLSDSVPGVPAFQVSWSELQATIHESANLFYVVCP